MELWSVVIEGVRATGENNRYLWRINTTGAEGPPHELAAFGRALDRADALRKVARAFANWRGEVNRLPPEFLEAPGPRALRAYASFRGDGP